MTPLSRETARSRVIRQTILRILFNTFKAAPDVSVLADHIHQAFGDGMTAYAPEELDGEIVDLISDGLIEVSDAPHVGTVASKAYRITSRGRDFYRSNCPWAKVDDFSGGEKV